MRNILLIIKKELKRVFTDKRMLASLILPGLLIFVVYSIMGGVMSKMNSVDTTHEYKIYAVNEPEFVNKALAESNLDIVYLEVTDLDTVKSEIKNENADLYISYPNPFPGTPEYDASSPAKIDVIYNSLSNESMAIMQTISTILDIYEDSFNNMFDIIPENIASETEVSAHLISSFLPMFLVIFIFSGVLAVVPESIAGEKERGTIATLLVTPLKRTHLAIGKIVSLCVVSLICAASSLIGVLLSLPMLIKGSSGADLGITISYQALDYVYIALIIFTVVFLIVGLMSLVSAFAKSVKEANAYSTPIMILGTVLSIIPMLGLSNVGLASYFIPVFNTVIAITNVLNLEANVLGIVITIVTNIVYSLICAIILGKMFNSEKVMFSK